MRSAKVWLAAAAAVICCGLGAASAQAAVGDVDPAFNRGAAVLGGTANGNGGVADLGFGPSRASSLLVVAVAPQISIDDVTVTEGNAGTVDASFTVSLDQVSPDTVTVQYATADGSATQPADYTAASGTVTFIPGDTSETVTVPVEGDTLDEFDETYAVNLATPTNAAIADGSGAGTITDDDAPPALAIDDVSVSEGDAGTTNATFAVSLSAASGRTVTVDYATADGTATQPADYASGAGTLTFDPGQTSKQVTVPVNGDTLDEFDETFAVVLSGAAEATIADGSGTGTITDDDGPPSVSVSGQTVTEGNSGTTTATFTVSLSAASGKPVTVNYATADGTATQPADYAPASGTVQFAPGQTSQTFSVVVIGDTAVEPDETFTVTLSAPSNATLGAATATGTIVNDDSAPAPVVPTISIGGATVDPEGDAGTKPATFTVSLSAPATAAVSVKFATANATASAPADYAAATGTLSFSPGETKKTVTVAVAGETLVERDETFRVQLSDPVGATLGTAQGVGTIVDDDAPPLVKPPQSVDRDHLFCGTKQGRRCKGLRITAQFPHAPGDASWTFDAFSPKPGKQARIAVKYLRLGRVRQAIRTTAPVKVTFKLTGPNASAALRRIRKRKLTRLRMTTTFTSSAGKTTRTLNTLKLR